MKDDKSIKKTQKVLLFPLKAIGTATLIATGTVSAFLKGCADTIDVPLGSEIFGATKNASFNGIKSIWSTQSKKINQYSDCVETGAKKQLAETALKAANLAKKQGNHVLYEKYMAQYRQYST